MRKVVGVLLALALFCALPAVGVAQDPNPDDEVTGCGPDDTVCEQGGGTEPDGGGDTVSSGNDQDADVDQDAEGSNAGNQAAICQQNAGGDAICEIDQSQRFGADVVVGRVGVGGDGDVHGRGGVGGGFGVGGGGVGGGVQSVTLARTGFDAWVLGLVGGVLIAGGIGLLAARRRGLGT